LVIDPRRFDEPTTAAYARGMPRMPGSFDLEAVGSVEHYEEPELYDHEYRRRRADVNFYRQVAREVGGPILELGCGTGRVLTALCRDGHRVIGLDRARPMLEVARARLGRLGRAARRRADLLQADFRAFALGARFPLVICPFNAFQHLYERADVESFLGCVAHHLAENGTFVFDILQPDLDWLTRDPAKHWAKTRFRHPRTGRPVLYSTNHTYDPIRQIAFIRIFYEPLDLPPTERRTRVVRLAHRQYFPREIEELLHYNGFRVGQRLGGFHGEAPGPEADSQVFVCAFSVEKIGRRPDVSR
jgi:SAM-dependent methyltransferase